MPRRQAAIMIRIDNNDELRTEGTLTTRFDLSDDGSAEEIRELAQQALDEAAPVRGDEPGWPNGVGWALS
jgi:hypothetical protein